MSDAVKARSRSPPPPAITPRALRELRAQLAESQATLHAIRSGQVDAVVVTGRQGDHVFTLEGADHAYRVLIESMNEGALTLTPDAEILYANGCFARMVKHSMEQVIGGTFHHFLSPPAQNALRGLLHHTPPSGNKIAVELLVRDQSSLSVQLSVQVLTHRGSRARLLGMVVTDVTEARRNEGRLRALTERLVNLREAERGCVALELHDHITQLLCATQIQTEVLAETYLADDRPGKSAAAKLSIMLGHTAMEVERISRSLRPGVLDDLGLVAALREIANAFAQRTGLVLHLSLPGETIAASAIMELALYRILQEALLNIASHARASHVTVQLKLQAAALVLTVRDDGIGFNARFLREPDWKPPGLGLVAVRERAHSLGGNLRISSRNRIGTTLIVRLPCFPQKLLLS